MGSRTNRMIGCAALGAVLMMAVALTAASGGAHAQTAADDPLRLGNDVVPARQQVTLKLDADLPNYTGATTIELRVGKQTDTFRLHAEEMTLESVELKGPAGPVPVSHEAGPGKIGLVTLKTEKPLTPGAYTLTVTTDRCHATLVIDRHGVRVQSLEVSG